MGTWAGAGVGAGAGRIYSYAPYAYAPYDAYWWTTGYAARTYPNGQYGGQGALDLDVRPEKAEVHLDGKYIGRADDFDGFPTYLWLPQGTYDVVFYHPGRRTLARQYSIYAGLILDVSDRLEEGEAIRPEDLPARSTVNRDARLQRDRERREEAEQMEREPGGYWQRYEERHRERAAGQEQASGEEQASALHLRVTPGDASVYLDGRFVGTGDELRQREPALGVDAGEHRLEVVRPGHRPAIRTFSAVAGEPVLMEVEARGGRRGLRDGPAAPRLSRAPRPALPAAAATACGAARRCRSRSPPGGGSPGGRG